MEPQRYAVFLFPSVSHALKAEKILIRACFCEQVPPPVGEDPSFQPPRFHPRFGLDIL
jgi:hypothetical protein